MRDHIANLLSLLTQRRPPDGVVERPEEEEVMREEETVNDDTVEGKAEDSVSGRDT